MQTQVFGLMAAQFGLVGRLLHPSSLSPSATALTRLL